MTKLMGFVGYSAAKTENPRAKTEAMTVRTKRDFDFMGFLLTFLFRWVKKNFTAEHAETAEIVFDKE